MNLNNAINENPNQNRQKRVQEAMTYHDPVEEKIRAFDARVAAAKEKEAAPLPAAGGDDTGNPPAAPAEPTVMQRMEGDTMYDIEQRDNGFFALAKTPVGGQTIEYPEPLFLGDTLPPDAQKEQGFLDTMMNAEFPTPLDVAAGAGDAAEGAFKGYGAGLSKFLSNTARTIASSPLGEAFLKPEQIDQFETLVKDFNAQVDAVAGEGVDTTAGKIAGGVGEIGGQYVMPAVLGYRFFTGMGANPLTASLMADGVTALLGVAPEAENLSNLIPEDSETFGALRDLMATNPDDPDWMNRARNATEAMTVLLGGEAAIKGGKQAIEGVMEGVHKITKFAQESGLPQEFGAAFNRFIADESGAFTFGKSPQGTPLVEPVAKGQTLDRAIALLHDTANPDAPIVSEEIATQMRAAVKATGNAVEGIDFNLSRIENGDQLGALINEVSKVYEAPIGKAKRGIQTFDVTQTKADMTRTMGFDVDEILKRQPGELWPAHKIKAARDIFVQQVNTTTEMANAIKAGNNSSEALIAFRRQLAVNAALQAQIKGVQTEAARALSQFRMTAKSPLEGKVQIEELLQMSGGAEANDKIVQAYLNAVEQGGPDAAAVFARQANNATTSGMVYEAWINSLLGSPTTHLVNMTGNTIAMTQGLMEKYAAAAAGGIERTVTRVPGGVTFSDANSYAYGLTMSVWDALRAGARALKTGKGSDIYGKLDYHREAITAQNVNALPIAKSIAGRLGKDQLLDSNGALARTIDYLGEYYYRLPGRFLLAEDEFFGTLNYRAALHEQGAREATVANLDPVAAQQRMTAILADPQLNAPEIHMSALANKREFTFQEPAGAAGQAFQKMLNNIPGSRYVVPFFNVINNITKFTARRTPGLPWTQTWDDLFSGDPVKRHMAMGKWATGGSIMGMAGYLNLQGVCTGRMTDNPKLLETMKRQGKQPFSCVVPMSDGTYKTAQYNRLDPVGMMMGLATTTAEVMNHVESPDEREMLGIAAVSAIMPYMEDKSFFQGISNFMNAIHPQYGDDDARVEALSRYFSDLTASVAGSLAGPLGPNTAAGRFITREVVGDDTRRSAEASPYRIEKDAWGEDILVTNGTEYRFWERMVKKAMSGTPGLSDNLPPVKNLWGDDIIMENGLSPDSVFSPIATTKLGYDADKLRKANLPDRMKAGYFYGMQVGLDLTEDQFKKFISIVGIDGEMERLGAPVAMPQKRISAMNGNTTVGLPVDLNADQYANFIEIMNKISVPNDADPERKSMNMRQYMDWMVRQPEYARLADDADAIGSKGDMLRKVQQKYKAVAVNLFFNENKDGPALFRKSVQMKMQAQNTGVQ
jgi:hypothetical protein